MFLFRPDPSSQLSQQSNRSVLLIKGGYNIAFDCLDYTPMVLTIRIRPERDADLIQPETLTLFPEVSYSEYIDSFGNRCTRLIAPPGRLSIWNRFIVADSGMPEELPINAYQHQVGELPEDTLGYLVGSRYCDTQKLSELAWSLFGGYWRGYPVVEAIMNYTHNRIRFSYANARPDRTAFDAHEERTGVCRDYAHLAITLFRCMNIPARYCTGYLGDIGVPRDPAPMDFSAWLEIYMGGRWWTLDARHNQPRIGRIVMARGRDAADVAISTAFGNAGLAEFQVITEV
jgi:transglutaminase-like putative cysteine protease